MRHREQIKKYAPKFSLFLLIFLPFCQSKDNSLSVIQEIPFEHVIVDANNPPNPHCKTVGDINGDHFPDILAASSTGDTTGLFWYEYPNWTKHKITGGSFSTDMQVGDVDGDGDLDAIIPMGRDPGRSVWWYENPLPDGRPDNDPWPAHKIANATAHDLEVADLGDNGSLDVVVRLIDISILLQESTGNWTKIQIQTDGHTGLALSDIDRDGRIDLVLDGYWLKAPADPTQGSWQKYMFADGWEGKDVGVTPTDLNNDNRIDIIIAPAESKGALIWYEAPADPTIKDRWMAHTIDSTVSHIHTFKVADMDLDGDTDVVIAEMHQTETRRVAIYLNEGDALHWKRQIVATTGSHNIRLADIDNDGDMDIVGANWSNDSPTGGAIELWRNNLIAR